jgi:uncharacterized protein YecT (DUF1311 family)
MRILIALIVLAGLGALPAAASTPLKPPVIHETFTPLPCPQHPQTTVALVGCAEKAILGTDRKINAEAKVIFGLLKSHAARESFVAGEKSWLAYRRSSCTAQASVYQGGSAQPVVFAQCVASRNRTHLTDLAALRNTLRPH